MVRIANPNEKQTNWHTSEIDPDVRYLIEPLTNSERVEMMNYAPSIRPEGSKKGTMVQDTTWLSKMLIRASLRETVGILDPDNDDKELEFRFSEKTISKRLKVRLCQREIFDKIPSDLLAEITLLTGYTNEISEEEEDDINFTSNSSEVTNTDPAKTAPEITTSAESKVDSKE